MAGYSGTPLPKKLGIKEGAKVLLIDPPDEADELLQPLPAGVALKRGLRGRGPFDVILLFVRDQAGFTKRFDAARARLDVAGGLWVAFPKKASGLQKDLNEDGVRRRGLAAGLVDNKVCAVSDVWSGLRLCVRVKDR